ncbi:hypothetical protein M747DRAFT_299618 [Aspergillus niger ATCC 13496]|uniref:Uncharacterized protein n=1 Tax=Aspergillus niger ATCC 13496 TaxID=1353008 RepID=A0A370BI76_ASPNG|nr:hypothetical protein M747DRAFT_299618 [Aspergillus niger ATCC 13496]
MESLPDSTGVGPMVAVNYPRSRLDFLANVANRRTYCALDWIERSVSFPRKTCSPPTDQSAQRVVV